MTVGLELLLVVICLLGTAFFAGMETGVISMNRLRLKHLVRNKVRGARIISNFLDHPDDLLGTTLVGTNVCTVTGSVLAASVAASVLGKWGGPLSTVIMTLILLIGCEYLPKAWFQSHPAKRVLPFARFLRLAGYVFHPIGRIITTIANSLIPSSIRQGHDIQTTLTREELKYLTRESEQSGTLSSEERKMIHGVFELTHKNCLDVMTPLKDTVLVSSTTTREDILALAHQRGLTRLPVYQDNPKNVVGIIHVLDLALDASPGNKTARNYMRAPQFVPADTPIDEILARMRLTRQPLALVNDKRARVIGLLTTEDVLREIVGTL